jgi:arginine deiminase
MLGVERLTVLTANEDAPTTGWNRAGVAYPFLLIEPGLVICDERSYRTHTSLRHHGIEVVTVSCSELGRGRGGPRGVTCAIERDAA